MPITGGCFCGAVTYQINGKLGDATSCHCSRCRKIFSAQASAVALVNTDPLVNADQFQWLSGESLLTSYVGEHGYGVQFCQVCGSTLCTVYNDTVIQVTLGCVNGDPDVKIGRHIYVGSKARWEVIADGRPQFDEGPM